MKLFFSIINVPFPRWLGDSFPREKDTANPIIDALNTGGGAAMHRAIITAPGMRKIIDY